MCSRGCLFCVAPAARRLKLCKRAQLLVGKTPLELGERLFLAATLEPAADQSLDRRLEAVARDAPEDGPCDCRIGPERAAHEDVVGGQPASVGVLSGRALEPEVSHPVLRAGVRAAVEVQPQIGYPHTE